MLICGAQRLQVQVTESCPSGAAICNLVLASGAKLLKRAPVQPSVPASGVEGCRMLVLYGDEAQLMSAKDRSSAPNPLSIGVEHISHKWLTDSAGTFTIQPLAPYRMI